MSRHFGPHLGAFLVFGGLYPLKLGVFIPAREGLTGFGHGLGLAEAELAVDRLRAAAFRRGFGCFWLRADQ